METQIDKILKDNGMDGCKEAPTPAIKTDLEAGGAVDFPIRKIIGQLLFVAVAGRPDIQF